MNEQQQIKRWVQTWQQAGPELEKIRRQEIHDADTAGAILILSDAFEAAIKTLPPRPSSGLVEQQRLFRRVSG